MKKELKINCIGSAENNSSKLSDMLWNVFDRHGLIAFVAEKFLDARPLSLVMASKLSSGQNLGAFALPEATGILYVEGELTSDDVQAVIEKSSLGHHPEKIHFFSFTSLNQQKETQEEKGIYLPDPENGLAAKLKEKSCDVVILHNLATVSNYFLEASEKDALKEIKRLKDKNATVIVFVENGTKGSALLQSMADVVFEVAPAENHFDAPINISCIKKPSFEIEAPQPFCLSLSVNNDGWTVTEETDPEETLDLIITLSARGKTQAEIGAFIGLQQYQVSRLLQKAEKMGLINRSGRTIRRIK